MSEKVAIFGGSFNPPHVAHVLAVAWVLAGAILACLMLAIATDLARRIIPNGLVLVVLGCGLGLRLVAGPWPLLASLCGALAAYDLLGWGDAKLIAAVTFIVPVDLVIPLLLAIALAGGLLSCLYLTARFALRRLAPFGRPALGEPDHGWTLRGLARREGSRILANEPMPYAVAVLGGVAFGLVAR